MCYRILVRLLAPVWIEKSPYFKTCLCLQWPPPGYKVDRCNRFIMKKVKAAGGIKNPTEQSDAELIDACLNGNQDAWESLIRRYQNLIYSVPINYRFSAQDAADIFQSVCIILLQKLKTLRSSETLSSWLYVTTRRQCWKAAKKRSREVELEEDFDGPIEAEGENLVLLHQLRAGLEQLSEKCRELLNALYYAEPPLTYDEITSKFGIPPGSIGPTRARCIDRLRKVVT